MYLKKNESSQIIFYLNSYVLLSGVSIVHLILFG